MRVQTAALSAERQTLAYARSISDYVVAVNVANEEEDIEGFRARWEELAAGVPLVIIESPYRALVGPLLKYIDEEVGQATA